MTTNHFQQLRCRPGFSGRFLKPAAIKFGMKQGALVRLTVITVAMVIRANAAGDSFGRAFISDLVADPGVVDINGAFHGHATTDGAGVLRPVAEKLPERTETYLPVNAVGGSNGSCWPAAGNDPASWWQLDLGAVRDIKPTAGHAYKLEVSSEGKTWQPYDVHKDVSFQVPHIK